MSTSDSDYSIDWLASDEDDCYSPKRLSPQRTEEPPIPPESSSSPSSSSSSLRESPSNHLLSSATQRRRTSGCCDCKDGGRSLAPLQTPAVSPLQGFTSVYTPHPSSKRAHGAGVDGLCEKPQADTENEKFSHKCTELQCYIQPLSSILRGLRSGRYSKRLSSFQESVAIDRIQRIMGVLQNPNMGGRFLGIVLKIEEMLHSWFPHIKPDQSRMDASTPAKKQKQCLSSASPPPPSSPASLCSSDVDSALAASDSSTRLKWLHTSPICSLKTPESSPGRPSSSSSPPPPSARTLQPGSDAG
ncbi:hypothetical protein L3Q82_008464 [Scortum barcoo]|uniref:Uncharacterized protein n=1 Tax=Scortum barcoo TaxID=214431 RepID=A0ACB8XD84_9TELE|nr:hypothetical protein L3Q82_008464 [Scortum barcoo]